MTHDDAHGCSADGLGSMDGGDDFAQRLRTAIQQRGWSQTRTAEEVRKRLGPGESFSVANITHYLKGRSRPNPRYRQALMEVLALDNDTEGQAEAQEVPPANNGPVPVQDIVKVEDEGERVRLQVDVRVPWPVAIRVLDALKGQSSLS